MTRRKNNKRALTLSLLSLLLCMAMLVGSTFAWFTDNATTKVNTIQAGTLDIQLLDAEAATANSLEGKTLTFAKAEGHEDEAVLFEPGAKYSLQQAWLYNAGNLHAKYKVVISGIDGNSELAKVLDVWVDGKNCGTLASLAAQSGVVKENTIAPKAFDTFGTIELMMQTTAGNEYQGLTMEGIAITVMATQAPVEYDSTTNEYDKDAEFTTVVATPNELQSALTNGKSVLLTDDITLDEALAITKNATIDLNGNTMTLNNNSADTIAVSDGVTLTISNGELEFAIDDPSYNTTYDAISVTNATAGTTTQVNLENVKINLEETASDWNDGTIHVSATAGEAVLNIGEGTVINTNKHLVFVVEDNSTVNMTDGEINMSNYATPSGYTMSYGINLAGPNAAFNMTGGKITTQGDVYIDTFSIEDDGVVLNISGGEITVGSFNSAFVNKYATNPTINVTDGVVQLTGDQCVMYR